MPNPDLFDWKPRVAPFQRHSETSAEAAAEITRDGAKLFKMHKMIFDHLSAHPDGATDEELQFALNMNPSTQRPRRIELVARGYIKDTGTVRLTRSGRNAIVWAVLIS